MTITKIQSEGLAKPVDLADNEKIRLGTDNDFELYHNGSGAYIQNKTGTLYIASNVDDDDGGDIRIQPKYGENSIVALDDGAVELYNDNVKTFATKSGGNTLYGTDSSGNVSNGRFYYKTEGGTVKSLFDPNGGKFQLYDSVHGTFGNSHDLSIYHDGSNSSIVNATGVFTIKNSGAGKLQLMTQGSQDIEIKTNNELSIKCNDDGATELYFDGTKKFETTSAGNEISGNLVCGTVTLSGGGIQIQDDDKFIAGNGDDLQLFHNGSSSVIRDNGSGALTIQNANSEVNLYNTTDNEYLARFINGGASSFYHDGTKQFETSANGLTFPSGKGIDFSATSDAGGNSSELLDDYEEGTWTPSLKFGGNFNGSYSTQTGYYTRVGRLVTFSFRITLSSKGSNTGNAQVFGLPFAVKNNDAAYSGATFGWLQNMTNLQRWVCTQIPTLDTNASYIFLRRFETNLGDTAVAHQHDSFANNSDFIMQGLYVAD